METRGEAYKAGGTNQSKQSFASLQIIVCSTKSDDQVQPQWMAPQNMSQLLSARILLAHFFPSVLGTPWLSHTITMNSSKKLSSGRT